MALSALDNKNQHPEPATINRVLGKSARHWQQLITHVSAEYPHITQHWHFAGPKFGWSLRLKQRNRIVLYLVPQEGHVLASIVLGEKAAHAAHEAGLPTDLLAIIEAAPRYSEGRGIRIQVSTATHVTAIQQLVALKMGA